MDDSRRSFFSRAILALNGLIAGAIGLPAAAYLLLPGKSKNASQWIEAGELSQLKLRSAEEVVFRRMRVDGWKVTAEKTTAWVVKLADNQVVAYAPQCTHLGCAYNYDERKGEFVCPCHTSNFSLEGKVLNGPAPRALDRYTVKIENGKVLIGNVDQPVKGA